jgi:uncharacterized protein YecE (DUF72 family)
VIRLGPSGFSYDDWVGPVYPPELARKEWLNHIAGEFSTLELNVTYYRVPGTRTVEGWAERTPPDFLFSVKAHQSMTHERTSPDFAAFCEGMEPLRAHGKLACLLAQFPHSFHPTAENRAYLLRLREGLAGWPVVIEFRDRAWLTPDTFAGLEELQFGFCCVDEPALPGLMPPVVRATGPLAYVRFHGRNAKQWWDHEQAWQRYDYTYRPEDLADWIPRLRQLDSQRPLTLVYANNHYRGQSVQALRLLKQMLAG